MHALYVLRVGGGVQSETECVNNAARFAGLPPSPFAQAGWEKC